MWTIRKTQVSRPQKREAIFLTVLCECAAVRVVSCCARVVQLLASCGRLQSSVVPVISPSEVPKRLLPYIAHPAVTHTMAQPICFKSAVLAFMLPRLEAQQNADTHDAHVDCAHKPQKSSTRVPSIISRTRNKFSAETRGNQRKRTWGGGA